MINVYVLLNNSVLSDMDEQAQQLTAQGIRFNTRRTYSSAHKSYFKFCNDHLLPIIPTTEQIILWYIAHLNSRHIAASSMHVYLAALRSLHVMSGLSPPPSNTPRVKLALKAVLELNPASVQKYPITYVLLCHMYNLLALLTFHWLI
jgi:hypothetical protein